MKHMKRFLMIAIAFVLLVPLNVHAESYSYTITLYTGNVGTFSDGSTTKTYTVDLNGEVNFRDDIKDVVLTGDNANTYYVKGVREAGKDNNTVSATRFTVTSDREYVIAYGIKGNMVSYTVNYVDANGNALAESETYYGVVGDKPVVAYLYVDGYQPQAYNLTKTLSSNEADNVFTFTYTVKTTSDETVIDEGTTNNGSTTSGTTTNNTTTTDNNTTTGDNSNSEVTDDNNTAVDDNSNEDSNVDENGTQDIVDLDDNETPLENIDAGNADETNKNMLVYIGVAVVAIAALCGFLFFVFKKKKKDNKEDKQ